MTNFTTGNSHNGNQPIPCELCGHQSRDHNRQNKQPDGSWNGPCVNGGCTCKLYQRTKSSESIKPKGRWGFKSQHNTKVLPGHQFCHYFVNDRSTSLCGTVDIEELRASKSKSPYKLIFVKEQDIDFPYSKCKHCFHVLPHFLKTGKLKIELEEETRQSREFSQFTANEKKHDEDFEKMPDAFIQVPKGVKCSHPGCPETGGTYIRKDESIISQEHYCIKHNPRIKMVLAPSPKKRNTI